jgi:hypothetical protein
MVPRTLDKWKKKSCYVKQQYTFSNRIISWIKKSAVGCLMNEIIQLQYFVLTLQSLVCSPILKKSLFSLVPWVYGKRHMPVSDCLVVWGDYNIQLLGRWRGIETSGHLISCLYRVVLMKSFIRIKGCGVFNTTWEKDMTRIMPFGFSRELDIFPHQ